MPIVAMDCRGGRDVCEIADGTLFMQNDCEAFVESIFKMNEIKKAPKMVWEFSLDNVSKMMKNIYFVGQPA